MKRNEKSRREYTADAARAVLMHSQRSDGPCAVVTGAGRLFVLESSDEECRMIARLLSAASIQMRAVAIGSFRFRRRNPRVVWP